MALPVGTAVYSSPITEYYGGIHSFRCILQLTLNEENRTLRRLTRCHVGPPGESAAKDNSRRFGQNHHVAAEGLLDELENGGFSCSRAAGENDTPDPMLVCAAAGRSVFAELSHTGKK
jgi:hypothetical protein